MPLTRRALIAAAFQPPQHDELAVRLNEFAEAYNRYIAERKEGLLNIKQAKKLSALWHRVEACEGWPRG
jgi:hypothetical protein